MTLPQRVERIVRRGLAVLHPCVYGELGAASAVADLAADLEREIALLMTEEDARRISAAFVAALPEVKRLVESDVIAAYEGDPAATSRMEVVMAYPGLYAVTVHRLAHELYRMKVPIIPRVMSELAHSKTGIDIHPGATIGERFFIDHGTGVVIGETTVIGRNVKLYQGVTLGALSFDKDPVTGALVKGVKRHPNVEDNVVIYAGATILGGGTVIGHDSEIGGNVWLKDSVPPNSRVYNRPPAPSIRTK
ncbi:MAG: serine acetyltransferase [Kiritimatiellae bacterium]|nr:serine acetyltransferase [Kiritimatiellia bacterium]